MNKQRNRLLAAKHSYLEESSHGIAESSMALLETLLEAQQALPKNTLFDDDVFACACKKIDDQKTEARVIQDIGQLIVPSAETLATLGAKHLEILAESVNAVWTNLAPIVKPRPQPDYSVGFTPEAFTPDQLAKLSTINSKQLSGDKSLFMATEDLCFPFLACEAKSGSVPLDIADGQNAHSMTLAVRGVAELFRAVSREGEVDGQILAFSVSYNNRVVRIYGHYPVIDGETINYHRHLIHEFLFTGYNGKEKWTTYRFTRNIYDLWMPIHFRNICSALDQLPPDYQLDIPSLSATQEPQDSEKS